MALQVYRDDGGMTLFLNDGSVQRLSADELENLERIANKYEDEHGLYRAPHAAQVASLLPEAKEFIVTRNKDISVKLQQLLEQDRRIERTFTKHIHKATRDEMLKKNALLREDLLAELEENKERLSYFGTRGTKVRDFQAELQSAKAYPIDQLVRFVRGTAVCLWHNDRNPSMHYYKKQNRVHCFACNTGGDTLDVVMKIRGCSLKEAVKYITSL